MKEHEEGASFYSLEKKYGITLGTVKRWNSAFRAHGEDALVPQNSDLCRYTAEFKKEVVLDYLSGGGSGPSIAVKYGIHAESTVLKWVKQYNSHEESTDSRKTGGYLMTKDIKRRKTTMEDASGLWNTVFPIQMIMRLPQKNLTAPMDRFIPG